MRVLPVKHHCPFESGGWIEQNHFFGRPVPVVALAEGTAALTAFYYGLLFTALAHEPLLRPLPFWVHVQRHALGQFDVDPQIIGAEGFIHAGKTYSYFGIFLLVRLQARRGARARRAVPTGSMQGSPKDGPGGSVGSKKTRFSCTTAPLLWRCRPDRDRPRRASTR